MIGLTCIGSRMGGVYGFPYGRYPFPSVCYVLGATHPGVYRFPTPASCMVFDLTAGSASYRCEERNGLCVSESMFERLSYTSMMWQDMCELPMDGQQRLSWRYISDGKRNHV
jgi:hypothetical protein